MNEWLDGRDGSDPMDDGIDTGQPIGELARLGVDPAPGFLGGVRGRIHRRVLASDLVDLSWGALARAFMEYLSMLFGIFSQPTDRGDENAER